MSAPLFSPQELAAHKKAFKDLEAKRDQGNFNKYWSQHEAMELANKVKQTRRAQARPEEFLDALLVMVGSRGEQYVEFDDAFALSDTTAYRLSVQEANTPENRRFLYTILKALTEVPRSWATSAFLRFLRGTGKQKDSKYHGAGFFGVRYGWKEDEVKAICRVLTDDGNHNPYCAMLMSYADVGEEIREEDPDFTVTDYSATFTAVRANRDVSFLEKLCSMLDSQGLGPVPVPEDVKPKKAHKPKIFHSGDVIKKSNLRDLPLPAHVRIPIERLDEPTKQWLDATIEKVVMEVGNGRYAYAVVQPNSKIAYPTGSYSIRSKEDLFGATYLGEWKGEIAKKKTVQVNFYYRRKES